MLKNTFLSFVYYKFFQSGFYFDFFIKKLSEVLVVNFFFITSIFFGEKFLIEYVTKKTIDNIIFVLNFNFFFFDFLFSKLFAFVYIFFFGIISIYLFYIF